MGLLFDTANVTGKDLKKGTKDPLSSVAKKGGIGVLWDAIIGGLLGAITYVSGSYQPPDTFARTAQQYLRNQDAILDGATARLKDLTTAVNDLKKRLDEAGIKPLPG